MSAMAKARDLKFCTRVGHAKSCDEWVFPKWAWWGSCEQFLHCGLRKFYHSKSSVDRWYIQLDRRRFVYDTYKTVKATRTRHAWVHMFNTHRPTLTVQLHNFALFRTCHTVLLRGSWQDFNWHDALRGPSAIAELLVLLGLHIVLFSYTPILVPAVLRVVRVIAGLLESNGSLPLHLWLTSLAGWLPRTSIRTQTLRCVIEYGLPFLHLRFDRLWLNEYVMLCCVANLVLPQQPGA